jgi:hypothetical protein
MGEVEGMKLNIEVNSGASYLLSLVAVVGYGFYIKAPFEAFWIPIASLYGWHSGRRLWRQLKLPNGTEIVADDPNSGAAK